MTTESGTTWPGDRLLAATEGWCGKTVRAVVENGHGREVWVAFTDGTFAVLRAACGSDHSDDFAPAGGSPDVDLVTAVTVGDLPDGGRGGPGARHTAVEVLGVMTGDEYDGERTRQADTARREYEERMAEFAARERAEYRRLKAVYEPNPGTP